MSKPTPSTVFALLVSTLVALPPALATAADPPPPVAVVFNTEIAPESRLVAEHYAARRGIPTNQIIGLPLPRSESISRPQYRAQLEQPLLEQLESRNLIDFYAHITPATTNGPGSVTRIPIGAKIRYLALCYGVPTRILEATNLAVQPAPGKPAGLMRNEAAVDSELALLPLSERNLRLAGPFANRLYQTTNLALLHPTNGLIMVTRLDGPNSGIARSLVDKAIEAETNGFWGRAYFDVRGITNGGYATGDRWIRTAFEVARRQGFESLLDTRPETLPAGFPMPQIALYAGWYAQSPTGPFTLPEVEFMPGAIAYHLFSFSASTVRTPNSWVGLLLSKGATATIGYVNEPYLDATVDVGIWFSRLFDAGATFAEAAYAASPALSWQTTVIGDPLYRPFARPPQDLHADLERQHSPLLAWSHLRVVNLNLAGGDPVPEMLEYLRNVPESRTSALLTQKIGDLEVQLGHLPSGLENYRRALDLKPTPQQTIHLEIGIARMLVALNRPADALDAFDRFCTRHTGYPDLVAIYREALAIAEQLGDARTNRYSTEIKLRAPPGK
jgi:uncharacterized protein (TIGR03790 family)